MHKEAGIPRVWGKIKWDNVLSYKWAECTDSNRNEHPRNMSAQTNHLILKPCFPKVTAKTHTPNRQVIHISLFLLLPINRDKPKPYPMYMVLFLLYGPGIPFLNLLSWAENSMLMLRIQCMIKSNKTNTVCIQRKCQQCEHLGFPATHKHRKFESYHRIKLETQEKKFIHILIVALHLWCTLSCIKPRKSQGLHHPLFMSVSD